MNIGGVSSAGGKEVASEHQVKLIKSQEKQEEAVVSKLLDSAGTHSVDRAPEAATGHKVNLKA